MTHCLLPTVYCLLSLRGSKDPRYFSSSFRPAFRLSKFMIVLNTRG